jgi:hypothetical protein
MSMDLLLGIAATTRAARQRRQLAWSVVGFLLSVAVMVGAAVLSTCGINGVC